MCLAWTRTRGSNMDPIQLIYGMTADISKHVSPFWTTHCNWSLESWASSSGCNSKWSNNSRVLRCHPWKTSASLWCLVLYGWIETLPPTGRQESMPLSRITFYNGWMQDHYYVSNAIAFCPDGTIPLLLCECTRFSPWLHGYWMGQYLCKSCPSVYESNGGKCAVDSAFSMKQYHIPC
jgi:hypothetical protein